MEVEDKLSNLPIDCLFQILSYFTPQELCTRISPLSKHFRSLARDPYLWTDLDMAPFPKFSLERLTRILQVASGIDYLAANPGGSGGEEVYIGISGVKHLSLRGRDSLDFYEMLTIGPYLHALVYLDISYCYSFDEGSTDILAQGCRNLVTLVAKGCVSMNEMALCHVSDLYLLRTLKINNNSNVTDLALATLGVGLKRLQHLSLKSIPQLTNSGLSILVHERYDTLRELEIDGSLITDPGIEVLARSCSLLRDLVVHTAALLTDASLKNVGGMATLRHLKLARCKKFTEDGFSDFFHENVCDQMAAIDFSECRAFTNYVASAMCLRHGPTLEKVYLSFCWELDDDAFETILNSCPHLTILELAGLNRLTWTHVPEIPSKLPDLRFLDLRQCNTWIDDDIVKIVKAMPNLMVINFMGYEVYQKPGIGIIHSPRRICE